MAIGSWVWGALADWQGLPFALHSAAAFLLASLVIMRIIIPMPSMQDANHAP
jgi:hypothetical protein